MRLRAKLLHSPCVSGESTKILNCERRQIQLKMRSSQCLRFGLPLALILLCLGGASAQQSFDFRTQPFFQKLVGAWITEGEIKLANGTVVKSRQEWKAEVTGENSFGITGTREMNGLTTRYKWTIKRLDSGIFEHVYQPDLDKLDTQVFEARVFGDNSRVELTALLENHAKVTIVQGFKAGDPDVLEVKVTLTDGTGAEVYSGSALGRRQKKP
jgi:hypothetical protein